MKSGAAKIILDQNLSGETLAHLIRYLYMDSGSLKTLGQAAEKLGRPEAAKKIVDECYALLQG